MRIIVTGAAGFIGYHLCKRLAEAGHSVGGIDNFNDYYDVSLKRARAALLRKNHKIHVEDRSVGELNFGSGVPPHLIIHLAAYAGVRDSYENPLRYIEGNIVETQKMIDMLESIGRPDYNGFYSNMGIQPRIIYASTSCVMAGQPLPWKENHPIVGIKNAYGYSKFVNEIQFDTSLIKNAVGLRFFTVYGPWGRPDMALFTFVDKILKEEPITVFNDGNMVRDFTYIDDIIDGIMSLVDNPIDGKEIFNIGRGQQVQLMDFIEIIEKKVGKKAILEKAPAHPADTIETWSDTTKLKKARGYSPKVNIKDGVSSFVDWFRSYYDR